MKRQVTTRGVLSSSIARLISRAAFGLAVGFAIAITTSSACAESGSEGAPSIGPSFWPSSRSPDEGRLAIRRWYGYQTMISDVFSTSLLFAGAASLDICISPFGTPSRSCQNEVPGMLILGGVAGYALGGPVIHAAHGHWDKAGYSLGLRIVPVAAAIGIGAAGDAGNSAALLVGGTALTAMILDSALLGYETVAVETPRWSLLPSYDVKSRAGTLAVVGKF